MYSPQDLDTEADDALLESETYDPVSILGSGISQLMTRSALRGGNERLAVRFAMLGGLRHEGKLTDLLFYNRHPERQGRPLQHGEQRLIREWLELRAGIVRPELRISGDSAQASSVGPRPSASAGNKAANTALQPTPVRIPLRKVKQGYAGGGGGRVEDVLKTLKLQGKLSIEDKDIEMLQRIANVESGGQIQQINSYDNAYMSFGFLQWPILYDNKHGGKLQRLIALAPDAFAKYGIELDLDRRWGFRRGEATYTSIPFKGVRYAKELRSREWAERFYRAGIDPDIIVAEVQLALQVIEEAKQKIASRIGNYFLPHYQKSNALRALIQESFNHRPSWLRRALATAIQRAKRLGGVETPDFLVLTRDAIKSVWAANGKAQSGRNLVSKTARLTL